MNTTTSRPRSKHTHVGIELFRCQSTISLLDVGSTEFALLLHTPNASDSDIRSCLAKAIWSRELKSIHCTTYLFEQSPATSLPRLNRTSTEPHLIMVNLPRNVSPHCPAKQCFDARRPTWLDAACASILQMNQKQADESASYMKATTTLISFGWSTSVISGEGLMHYAIAHICSTTSAT